MKKPGKASLSAAALVAFLCMTRELPAEGPAARFIVEPDVCLVDTPVEIRIIMRLGVAVS